jgi:ferrochelatase
MSLSESYNPAQESTAYLLLNLGTPDSPKKKDVRKYLDEFLMDPYVVDIPFLFRFLLVKGIILRTRPKKSAEAYAKIWTERGSPLKYHLEDLTEKVKKVLGPNVFYGMRYGKPSLKRVLKNIFANEKIKNLKILALYPQWAWASQGSMESHYNELVKEGEIDPLSQGVKVEWIRPFYNHPDFISLWASQLKKQIEEQALRGYPFDQVLMSFHGIPERQLGHPSKEAFEACLKIENCCEKAPSQVLEKCYRAQCFKTAELIAHKVGLARNQWTVSFQSRLGRTPWLKPFTDVWLTEQKKNPFGYKNIIVVSASFVADCLETLEELAIRAKEDFESPVHKGDSTQRQLSLVPSLNSQDPWAQAVAKILVSENPA